MKYFDKTFKVGFGATQDYRDGWERTFGKKNQPEAAAENQEPVDSEKKDDDSKKP